MWTPNKEYFFPWYAWFNVADAETIIFGFSLQLDLRSFHLSFSSTGSRRILLRSLEIVHSASSTTLFFWHFFLSLTLHSCHFRPLFPCPPSPPSCLSLSFIQFNFELCTCRQGKRIAPWLPGTGPSHYTGNWFWPAAMSAAHLPHSPQHLCTPDCLQQRRSQNTQDGDKQLHFGTSNQWSIHALLHTGRRTNKYSHNTQEEYIERPF